MKIRRGHVSNSSSSSFLMYTGDLPSSILSQLEKQVEEINGESTELNGGVETWSLWFEGCFIKGQLENGRETTDRFKTWLKRMNIDPKFYRWD